MPGPSRIPFSPMPGGQLTVAAVPSTTPEGIYASTGRRPVFPLFVYSINQTTSTLTGIPNNGSFVMSMSYIPTSGDGLTTHGAAPGYIGTLVVRAGLANVIVFRAPADNEVVRLVNLGKMGAEVDGGFFQWTGTTWKPYLSMPQRAMRGMQAFGTLDPDSVFDFWGSLLGGLQYSLTNDAVSLKALLDADLIPDDYLPLLGAMFGIVVDQTASRAVQRYQVKSAVPRNRLRGLSQGITLQLFLLGYVGYANEIWVNPTAPSNWTAIGSAPSGIQTQVAAEGLFIDPNSGVKGQDWVEVAHLSASAPSLSNYVPSSRLSIHINGLNGTPISPSVPDATLTEIKQTIVAALAQNVLPAHVSVRVFATDLGGGAIRYF